MGVRLWRDEKKNLSPAKKVALAKAREVKRVSQIRKIPDHFNRMQKKALDTFEQQML